MKYKNRDEVITCKLLDWDTKIRKSNVMGVLIDAYFNGIDIEFKKGNLKVIDAYSGKSIICPTITGDDFMSYFDDNDEYVYIFKRLYEYGRVLRYKASAKNHMRKSNDEELGEFTWKSCKLAYKYEDLSRLEKWEPQE